MTFILAIQFINLIVNAILVGLIWMVQCVHYPSFHFIGKHVDAYHSFHVRSITPVVAPLMIIELMTSILLFYFDPNLLYGILLLLVVFIWLSTFLIQVPVHQKLKDDWNKEKINFLIKSNWIRTILWSLKLGVFVWSYLMSN